MNDLEDDVHDPRTVELGALAAIYPEMVVDKNNVFTVTLPVPVQPQHAVTVSATNPHELSHLPPLQLRVTLPDGYPETQPPQLTVSTTPEWLSENVLRRLAADATRLWQELGHDLVVFAIIDHVQQAANDDVFGLASSETGILSVNLQHQVYLIDYDVKAKQEAFCQETFTCGICLDPKKGSACHRMQNCGHVFCVQCLKDFYTSAITSGDLASVRCPEPNCAKQREKALQAGQPGQPGRPAKLVSVSPSELLQIPLEEAVVKRYVDLKYKTRLESDKDTVYCPRTWCNGAARSKKRRRPVGFEEEEEEEEEEEKVQNTEAEESRLAICEDCGFAFCSRCYLSWHGDFVLCAPRKQNGEVSEEEKASLRYLERHTSACPTCMAPVQKSHGCNHMICFRCSNHFCYLCSAWLEPHNPYRHFNIDAAGRKTDCYNRLWDLESGDGSDDEDDGGRDHHHGGLGGVDRVEGAEGAEGAEGGDGGEGRGDDILDDFGELLAFDDFDLMRDIHARHQVILQRQQQDRRPGANGRRPGHGPQPPAQEPQGPHEPVRQVHVAREGPLVLRINLEEAANRQPAAHPARPGPARDANEIDEEKIGEIEEIEEIEERGGAGEIENRGGAEEDEEVEEIGDEEIEVGVEVEVEEACFVVRV